MTNVEPSMRRRAHRDCDLVSVESGSIQTSIELDALSDKNSLTLGVLAAQQVD